MRFWRLWLTIAAACAVGPAAWGQPAPGAEAPPAETETAGTQPGENAEAVPSGGDSTPPAAGARAAAARGDIQADTYGDEHYLPRRTVGFVSYVWPPVMLITLFFWVRAGDWINQDSQVYELGYAKWNTAALLPYTLAFPTLFLLPAAAAAPLLLTASVVPLVVYAVHHNRSVESHQRVFTRDWWAYEWAKLASSFGVRVEVEKKAAYEKGAAVDLEARGAEEETKNKANLLTARQSPGFVLVKEAIAEMVRKNSEHLLLDYRQDAVGVKHQIDGVWHNGEPTAREDGDVMLAVAKTLANLNPAERRSRQSGEIGARYRGVGYRVTLVTQGVKTGERAMVRLIDPQKKQFNALADLGMREKIAERWNGLINAESGLLITSAQPGAGVTTLTDVALLECDRLMRDVFSIEDAHSPDREIENLVRHTYDSKLGEAPDTHLGKLARLYPNAYVCRNLVGPGPAAALLGQVREGKLLVTESTAGEAVEAPLRLIKKGAPHKDVAQLLSGALNMRLIRLLCDACKVGYEPSPDYLKKLRIPPGKVTTLYRVPNDEEQKKPCEACGGLGYRGRTGLFELLVADDLFRETLLKQPKPDRLRKAARHSGMRTHQEEGILLVAKGATSIQELQRVLTA